MLNADAQDVEANLEQIERLQEAGCEIVRMAIPNKKCLGAFEEVCKRSPLPVVADIHFSAEIAVEAAQRGAAKLRINPGNIGGLEKTRPVLDAARAAGIPIRIGVNAGSLDDALALRTDLSLPEKLAASAVEYVRFCESCGFEDVVVSAKAHDVMTTVRTYRLLAREIPHVPLHIGVTEAGTLFQGVVKSASGLGILLEEGIGDTMRISLTDDPVQEMRAVLDAPRGARSASSRSRDNQLPHVRPLPSGSHQHGERGRSASFWRARADQGRGHGLRGERPGGGRRR